MKLLRHLSVLGFFAYTSAVAQPARADEIAPELETLELRQKAQAEAKRLLPHLSAGEQRRLVGFYVAFDPSATDPSAMVACDDDGDFVVVVTDAMLRLASFVARAQATDEIDKGHNIEDYAAFIGRSQLPGRRLLPPPGGFFSAQPSDGAQDTRLRESLAFILARELAHLRAGDLVCPHPTATHESGDDEWTPREQRRALETAGSVYPGQATARDVEATGRVLEAGRSEQGGLGLLHFFAQLEVERTSHASRFVPRYLVQHPATTARIAAVKTAARDRRIE